ncbi:hypothetical protein PFISCL1PPCAC_8254, partial [Pristionchus fissidentatus]
VSTNQYTMVDVATLSNDELRTLLIEHGKSVGPVGPSTRKLYEKQLVKLMAGGADTSILNNSSTSIPDELVARTPSPTRVKPTAAARAASAAAAARKEDFAPSSDEERGEESMRYLDEEEQEEYRRQLSPNGSSSPIFKNGLAYEVEQKKRGGVSTIALVAALTLLAIFTVFLLMRSLDMDGETFNHEEL